MLYWMVLIFAATSTEITDERLSRNSNTLFINHVLLIHHCVHVENEGFCFNNSVLLEASSSAYSLVALQSLPSWIHRFSAAYYHVYIIYIINL